MKKLLTIAICSALLNSSPLLAEEYTDYDDEYRVIQKYTQDELNSLIKKNAHLQRVKADDCQLVQDIEAHALKVKEPSYVFLWGDMLAWGVCVDRDSKLGMYYIREAAQQGLLAAIEQLGRYYERGILVSPDKNRAIKYFREAALQGHLQAQISYIRLLNQGYGSPYDYEDAYRALFNSVIEDPKLNKQAQRELAKLGNKMPGYAIQSARVDNSY